MILPVDALAIVAGFAVLANRLIEFLVKPIFAHYKLDTFWLVYIAWVVGGALVFSTGVNLFASYIPNAAIGQALTAIVAGGGANLLKELSPS